MKFIEANLDSIMQDYVTFDVDEVVRLEKKPKRYAGTCVVYLRDGQIFDLPLKKYEEIRNILMDRR